MINYSKESQATKTESVTQDWKRAIAKGSLDEGPHWPVSSMFDDVFKEMPAHLLRQRQQMGV